MIVRLATPVVHHNEESRESSSNFTNFEMHFLDNLKEARCASGLIYRNWNPDCRSKLD